MKKHLAIGLSILMMFTAALIFAGMNRANASSDTTTCVPSAAWTETINHPAVTHVVHHDAVTHVVHHDAVPDQWWNWSPNHEQGPFDGPPAFPTDARGTWQGPHENGGPLQDTYGTFQTGQPGNGDWFHREQGTAAYDETVVDQPAYDETVVDHEAWVETIQHPAVTCPNDGPCPDNVCSLQPKPDSLGDVKCSGVLNGGVYDNVTVAEGKSCTLVDTYVNGSVLANGARNLTVADATIVGNVKAVHVSGDVYMGSKSSCTYDPLVGGSVTVRGSHNVLLCDLTVCKDIVVLNNDGKITVRDSAAHRIVVRYNRRFVADRGDATHKRLSTIRLIHDDTRIFRTRNNAPRVVVRHN